MEQYPWTDPNRENIVCVDSYDNGVLQGRLYSQSRGCESFSSLSQFLIRMEEILDEQQLPQAYTTPRKFSMLLQPEEEKAPLTDVRKGAKATFELQVIFRQNTSWQGTLLWKEQKARHSYRSVLELVILMDSALRSLEK